MKSLFSQRGFGLLEVLVATALLGGGIYTIMAGLDYIEKNKTVTEKNVTLENTISSIVESVRANIVMEKIDFQASTTWLNNTTFEDIKNSLKICWDRNGMTPLEPGGDCPGRIGYVVTPMKTGNLEIRGLYHVTVRVVHSELFPGRSREYQFIVRGP